MSESKDNLEAALVGKNYAYYKDAWASQAELKQTTIEDFGKRMRYGFKAFNISAFFVSFLWLGYRKMYGHAALVFFGWLAASVVVTLLELDINFLDSTLRAAPGIVVGVYGNRWYKKVIEGKASEIRAQNEGNPELQEAIAIKAGGTNSAFVWVSLALIALVVVILFLSLMQA